MTKTLDLEERKIAVFRDKTIRRVMHGGEWWFSVIDVVAALTESSIPKRVTSQKVGVGV